MDDVKEQATVTEPTTQPEQTAQQEQPEQATPTGQAEPAQQEESKSAPTELPPSDPYSKAAETVDQWFNAHIHNSPASQYTEVYNHLSKAKDTLKEMLKEVFSHGTV